MLRIGLTGGIGCGKSTACRYFTELGTPIIDTDLIARELVRQGMPLLSTLRRQFGDEILESSGELNRTAMRQKVFTDPKKLAQLEALLHPAIRQDVQRQLFALDHPYVVIVIPLLLEKGWQALVDRILVVDCTEQQQLGRASKRDGVPAEQITQIMALQVSRQQRLAAADDILHNDGSSESLQQQVHALHQRYLSLARHLP